MIDDKAEELWDLYDKDRRLTGKTHRRGDRLKKGEYHLAVHVCIFNSKNELLIQQRQPFKEDYPNMWDLSIGGSALAGENSTMAAEREIMEELGLEVDLSEERPYFTINFSNGFDDYYIIEKEIELSKLKLQKEEVRQVRWGGKEEVLKMQEEGIMIPYWFLDRLFEIRGDYDAHGKQNPEIEITYAEQKNLSSWMNMVEIVRDNFPGLETEEKLKEYADTVVKNMERRSAVCALEGNKVVGILMFSAKENMLSCMAVHPEYRRRGIGTRMVQLMLHNLDRQKDIYVETFRENDEKGKAPRAFYRAIGFVEGELCYFENGYPEQRFILKADSDSLVCSMGKGNLFSKGNI